MIKPSTFGLERDHDFGFIGNLLINKVYLTTYICLAIFIVLSIILYKTKFGIRLRSCGENPQAADSLGINVYKMRYAGVTISGALAGIGGFTYALTTANCASTGLSLIHIFHRIYLGRIFRPFNEPDAATIWMGLHIL